MKLSGWGRYPALDCRVIRARSEAEVRAAVLAGPLIARGNGRAYGDSSLNEHATLCLGRFNRMLAFDAATGQLAAEAGVLLGDVIDTFLPRGWFPAVTPGTKHVTLGGMLAADVHGKNHHRDGGCSRFVDWIDVMGPDGETRRCSREENAELFAWTLGGMGLTGVILRAAVRLRPVETGWIRQTVIPAPDLAAAIEAFERNLDAAYSVAWIDCLASGAGLGRSVVTLGEHAALEELPPERQAKPFDAPRRKARRVPLDFPAVALNRLSVRTFNQGVWLKGKRDKGTTLVDWDRYFYPLDAVQDWNRIYGKRGFIQFQCVLPLESSADGLAELLAVIARSGAGSFLAVLKRMGEEAGGLSFPMPGYTLALDFPVTPKVLGLLAQLDRIVAEHHGRTYLAKDSRMSRDTFHATDPRAREFAAFRARTGAAGRFVSHQSERLGL